MEELLTVRQAADLYQVKEDTVRRWIREAGLPARRIGPRGLIRIPRAELEAWAAEAAAARAV